MPENPSLNRQQRIGGIIGITLLAFALVYRFFPTVLFNGDNLPAAATNNGRSAVQAPMGFDRGSGGDGLPTFAEDASGPPVSLASSDVITAYRLGAAAPVSEQLAEWLRQGDRAAAADRLAGDDASAASWYAQVLAADPDSRAARAGLAEVTRKLASRAHLAIRRGDEAQVRQLIDTLQSVPLAEAETARIEHEYEVFTTVTPMLAEAAALLQGRSVQPAQRDEALAIYREILALDQENPVAQQGLLTIQRFWLDRALAAVAQNDYEAADAALLEASAIVATSQGLQDTRSRVEGMRRMRAESILGQARSALDSGDLELARALADDALAIRGDLAGADDFEEAYQNAVLYGGYRPGQTILDRFTDRAGQGPELVVLPLGEFLMGGPAGERTTAPAELPAHRTTVERGVALGRTEVTVAQFREFVTATGYRTDADRAGKASVYDRRSGRLQETRGINWERNYAGERAKDTDPVVNVSWNDAQAYAEWLAARTGKRYRLPSEAEFEYALRAGTTTRYWWGDGVPETVVENLTGSKDRARNGRQWIHAFVGYGDDFWGPAPAGHFLPNPFGLYDMGGNVSEWVADCWHDNYTRAPTDGSAWLNPGCVNHVVRGGSWGSAPDQVRSSWRSGATADTASGRIGFRVARELGAGNADGGMR